MTEEAARVAIVTGGARGIGRAIVLRLLRGGWTVAFTFRSSADAAARLAEETSSEGLDASRLHSLEGNVADASRCASIVAETIARFGRIDALLNNAALRRDTLLHNSSDDDLT